MVTALVSKAAMIALPVLKAVSALLDRHHHHHALLAHTQM
jgi:hypothetical protein